MKRIGIVLLLISALQGSPERISCNERVKHGPKGLYKGVIALSCMVACGYFIMDVVDKAPNLRLPDALIAHDKFKRWPTLRDMFFKGIATVSMGYLAFRFGKESRESLALFLTDTEE